MTLIGRNLRAARGRRGWTQAELASEAGVSEGSVKDIESGVVTNPQAVTMGKLANALDTTLEALEGHEPPAGPLTRPTGPSVTPPDPPANLGERPDEPIASVPPPGDSPPAGTDAPGGG